MHPEETRIYYALLVGIVVLMILVLFFVVTITRYHRKKSEFETHNLRQQFQYLENEKERIAIDLHDDLGALLSAIKMRLHAIPSNLDMLDAYIELAEGQIDAAIMKIRKVSRNMMPSALRRKSLRDACGELIEYVVEHSDIEVEYTGTVVHAIPETEIQLYRITQEILNNIIKHSNAKSIYFDLRQQENKIILLIRDNGKGFDKKSVQNYSKGSGLKNILARAEIIKAKVYLTTQPHNGVEFLIETEGLCLQEK